MKRTTWRCNTLAVPYPTNAEYERAELSEANLVASETNVKGWHMPALDIDLPCELRPSSTDGHFHLLIDKPMTWAHYKKLLKVLVDVGIVEPGYYAAALERGRTYLRLPGVKKEDTVAA